ncbi:MAG: hypothetical protein K2X27_09815 [Candidatus Obscuribacterales bacterium]|nr:hypothetical protein [Candidatus Obscuribacterales bacterium]
MKKPLITGSLFLLLGLIPACADSPLPPPSYETVFSANKKYCISTDPDKKISEVSIVDKSGNKSKFWSMPGYFRNLFLANDGEHLVIGYDGQNLLPLNYKSSLPMLTFVHKGKNIKTVLLKELIPDSSKLEKTASHWHWGDYSGFDSSGNFQIETVDHRKLKYDPATGKILN